MKTLYETILSSTNSGKKGYIQRLLFSPNNAEALDKEWSGLGLDFDAGDGIGKWLYNPFTRTYNYRVTTLKPGRKRQEYILALTNVDNNDTLVVILRQEIGKRKIQKWAEKIFRILNMRIEYDKNYIHLKFV